MNNFNDNNDDGGGSGGDDDEKSLRIKSNYCDANRQEN